MGSEGFWSLGGGVLGFLEFRGLSGFFGGGGGGGGGREVRVV